MGISGSSSSNQNRSNGRRGSSKAVLSEINVTPLVDVMLVLLIIFMVTTPLLHQGIEVDLPKTSSTGVSVNDDPFTLVIDSNRHISAAKQNIALGDLRPKLKSIFQHRKNKQIYLQADRRVDYGFVAEVMAEIRGAGIFSIGLITNSQSGPSRPNRKSK